MISHKEKIIFIHIPKCAGSSVEMFFGVKPFKWSQPNYENLTGWCPKRKIHLQHATAEQLLELDLIDEETWNNYFKFAIVRNPWSRAVSDYLWINGTTPFKVSFKNYLSAKGRYGRVLSDTSIKEYRGDHLWPQNEFITLDGEIAVDKVIKIENLKQEFAQLAEDRGFKSITLPHDKKAKKPYKHYSHFYRDIEIEMLKQKFEDDIKIFNYKFEDRRDELTSSERMKLYLTRRF